MHKLWSKFKVHHLGGQVLSACIMNGDTTILATSDKNVTVGRVADLADGLIELSKLVSEQKLLDVEYAHGS